MQNQIIVVKGNSCNGCSNTAYHVSMRGVKSQADNFNQVYFFMSTVDMVSSWKSMICVQAMTTKRPLNLSNNLTSHNPQLKHESTHSS